jgi:hypothetical protein
MNSWPSVSKTIEICSSFKRTGSVMMRSISLDNVDKGISTELLHLSCQLYKAI